MQANKRSDRVYGDDSRGVRFVRNEKQTGKYNLLYAQFTCTMVVKAAVGCTFGAHNHVGQL